MTIKYISTFSVKSHHSMINRALIAMLCNLYPDEVECYVPASAVDNLKTSQGAASVKRWHKLHIPTGNGRVSLFMRYVVSALCNLWLLLLSKRDDVLFYDFNNPFSIKAINWLAGKLNRRVIVCCHGELEYIANADKHPRWYKQMLAQRVCGFFNHRRKNVNVTFIVFGEIIKKNLQPYLSDELNSRISSIDHPVICDDIEQDRQRTSTPIRIGTNGILNSYKGLETYMTVAEKLKNDKDICLVAVGKVQGDVNRLKAAGVEIYNAAAGVPLSDDEYALGVKSLDFIVMMYPQDTYRLIASGALLDAIRYERPVIALRTEYAQYMFDKYGAFGYLVDDVEQLVSTIRDAGKLKRDFDYRSIAAKLSPGALSEQMGMIIKKLGKG